jgi:diguanylate cyclase (GGDEF)-like protein
VSLKRFPEASDAAAGAPTPRTGADPSGTSILFVDPDPALASQLEIRLGSAGFDASVEGASTLRAGLAELAEHAFDVVLLSLATADAGGLEGIARIRTIDAEVPIVVHSDADDPHAAVQAIQRGAQDCVPRRDLEGEGMLRILRHAIERQRIMLELNEARQREQYLATHDSLTGIPNRMLFYDRLAQGIAAASRYGTTLAVLFLDLDGFKPINDTLGHNAGDRLLHEVAKRILSVVRKSDTAARVGGDEFGVILSQVVRPSDAATVAANVLRRIAEPVALGRTDRCIQASIGIAVHPGDGELADTLVRNADTAMYHAKQQGGNRYAFFHRRMRAEP